MAKPQNLTTEEITIQEYFNEVEGNVHASGSVNGGHKLKENSKQNSIKHEAIAKLRLLSYRTSAAEIESYLNIIFGAWEEKPAHWLYIAQHYTPKTINSVISQMIKLHQRKDVSIKIPGAYFSFVIKFRLKRKIFRRKSISPNL